MNTAILNPSIQQASKPFNAPKLFTAKRLVNTKNMTQSDWLEVRRQGIGSSDCAAACGLNPYMSMLELWMIKTGRVKQSIEDESTGHAPYIGANNLNLWSLNITACTPTTKSVVSMPYYNTPKQISILCSLILITP